ncbi:MAG: hypothetical protein KKF79_11135 [Gammaproteobacteria bacterium]|jgi:hypothetical protein|nr:hypothetical protein [Gammaproteobacteria bacterium]MBU2280040.1 hypothetical protein [Gammaproteobacteria bacterium]MBU2426313.1 hypothetical protein [Gammaproteobacteria bacterium]
MFFQILFSVVKGLLEQQGHVIDPVPDDQLRSQPQTLPVCTDPSCKPLQ